MSVFGPFEHFLLGEDYDTELLNLRIIEGEHVHCGRGRLVCKLDGTQTFWVSPMVLRAS